MGAAAADMVLVFGDIGQVRKVGKRAHHGIGLFARQLLEHGVQCQSGVGVFFAAKAHRGLADGLDHVEDGVAFLFAQHVAQQAAQQADIFFQWRVLVRAGGGVCFCCTGFIKHV